MSLTSHTVIKFRVLTQLACFNVLSLDFPSSNHFINCKHIDVKLIIKFWAKGYLKV